MIFNWKKFRVVVKLDPDKTLSSEALQVLTIAEIDAIIIGGTQNITIENSVNLFQKIMHCGYQGPIIQEISEPDVIIAGVKGYLLPLVLNTGELMWLRDAHLNAIMTYGELIPWEQVVPVGYLVCNPAAAVARKTKAGRPTLEEACAYLTLAEKIFVLPLFYIEYSGLFGDLPLIAGVANRKDKIRLIYGGGIKTKEHAGEVAAYVDTIVIGNLLYENPENLVEIARVVQQQ